MSPSDFGKDVPFGLRQTLYRHVDPNGNLQPDG